MTDPKDPDHPGVPEPRDAPDAADTPQNAPSSDKSDAAAKSGDGPEPGDKPGTADDADASDRPDPADKSDAAAKSGDGPEPGDKPGTADDADASDRPDPADPAGLPDPGAGDPERLPAWKAILQGKGPRGIVLKVGAPLVALLISLVITMILLRITGAAPFSAVQSMVEYGTTDNSIVDILNRATRYYLSAVAVAIGFRMGLLNIGVDGQYRLAAFMAAVLGGALALPAPLGQFVVIVAAMVIGGVWAAIAGVLKVTRGVSEVLSTIMLNAIATGLIAYLLNEDRLAEVSPNSNNIATPQIPEDGRVGPLNGFLAAIGIDLPGGVYGLLPLAIVVGIVFWVVINFTRFGFDLKVSGLSPSAAQASGVSARRMIVVTMILSGAVAGLIGMPELLGGSYEYSLNFPAGLGFTGITVALLGRNHPFGIALAALLFAFLDQSSDVLQAVDVPKEIVGVMQGVVVLTVVIVYELMRRWEIRLQQRAVAVELATGHDLAGETSGSTK